MIEAFDQLTDCIEVANPDAEISDAAIESVARLLLGLIEEEDEQLKQQEAEQLLRAAN